MTVPEPDGNPFFAWRTFTRPRQPLPRQAGVLRGGARARAVADRRDRAGCVAARWVAPPGVLLTSPISPWTSSPCSMRAHWSSLPSMRPSRSAAARSGAAAAESRQPAAPPRPTR